MGSYQNHGKKITSVALKPTNRKTKRGGSWYAALAVVVLILLAVAGYFWVKPSRLNEKNSDVHQPQKQLPSTIKVPEQNSVKPEATELPKPQKKAFHQLSTPKRHTKMPVTKPEKPTSKDGSTGVLAIIIDDMGSALGEAKSLAAMDVPLTFSIIPGLRNDRSVAAFAAANNIETMIHIPMQSKGWPKRRLEANGLLVGMSEDEISSRVKQFVLDMPAAVGVNNHMGSEFTEHANGMRAVLQVLKSSHLFYIDSVTSPGSLGLSLARELGIPTARRSVFLDNEQNEAYITGQINQAVKEAKKRGEVIAICHPHPATIATLSKHLPLLKNQGITLVWASKLVK